MGKGFKNGGSNPLNFKVKTYPSETELKADTPKENTIGVITTTTMTSWVFSATEPKEPNVGMVWISVGKASSVEFNALRQNTLQVYPMSSKQYVGSKWEGKTVYSYQGGKWKSWWNGQLFTENNQYAAVTGGWVSTGYTFSEDKYEITKAQVSDKIYLTTTDQLQVSYSGTKNKIDLTNFSTLTLMIDVITPYTLVISVVSAKSSFDTNNVARLETYETGEVSLDISKVNGNYYIVVWVMGTEGAEPIQCEIPEILLKE